MEKFTLPATIHRLRERIKVKKEILEGLKRGIVQKRDSISNYEAMVMTLKNNLETEEKREPVLTREIENLESELADAERNFDENIREKKEIRKLLPKEQRRLERLQAKLATLKNESA